MYMYENLFATHISPMDAPWIEHEASTFISFRETPCTYILLCLSIMSAYPLQQQGQLYICRYFRAAGIRIFVAICIYLLMQTCTEE